MQINNMVSKAIVVGQNLKLPISIKKEQAKNNKNHIDINHVTKHGLQNLTGD